MHKLRRMADARGQERDGREYRRPGEKNNVINMWKRLIKTWMM